MLSRIKLAGLALAGILAITLTAAACGSDVSESDLEEVRSQVQTVEGSLGDIQSTLDEIRAHQARAELVATMSYLNGVGFHEIDDELQIADELPTYLRSTITRARQIAEGTSWPEDLHTQVESFLASLRDFEQALQDEDLAHSKGGALETHRTWHLLEPVAYAYIAGEEADDHGHGHGEEDDDHGHDEENGDDHGHDEEDDHHD